MADDLPARPTPEDLARREAWFHWYVERLESLSVLAPRGDGVRYRCPGCRFRTLEERGGYDVCHVCYWEDDGQDDADADTVRGGPNGRLSLTQARENYRSFGACREDFIGNVRPPRPDEA